jgi:NADPH-dependent curcumin reductase CurA
MTGWFAEGTIAYDEAVVDGIEHAWTRCWR